MRTADIPNDSNGNVSIPASIEKLLLKRQTQDFSRALQQNFECTALFVTVVGSTERRNSRIIVNETGLK